jgi:hypothetical protein
MTVRETLITALKFANRKADNGEWPNDFSLRIYLLDIAEHMADKVERDEAEALIGATTDDQLRLDIIANSA